MAKEDSQQTEHNQVWTTNMKYEIIDDELKRLTNRCIGIMLADLDDNLTNSQITVIKKTIRQFESNIRKYILNEEQPNEYQSK